MTVTVLALLGPTASGKSALALEVARRWLAADRAVEVVAVDAFTVYRGMDVGTAKVAQEDRAEVVHHLVDVLDPSEELTVARFQQMARLAIDDVLARGATPLLVGGSGLYWRAVVDDLRFPPTDPAVRAAIEARWAADPDGAHAYLGTLDPDAAAGIAVENTRRIVRALEVIELTGVRFSEHDRSWSDYRSIYDGLQVAYLEPDAEVLRSRIAARARRMVEEGLLDEAADLRRGPQQPSRTAAQAIGYAEAFAVIDGRLDLGRLADAIAVRTWRYAKRQRGWFRADPRCTSRTDDEVLASWGSGDLRADPSARHA